jgi:hypothetical protein
MIDQVKSTMLIWWGIHIGGTVIISFFLLKDIQTIYLNALLVIFQLYINKVFESLHEYADKSRELEVIIFNIKPLIIGIVSSMSDLVERNAYKIEPENVVSKGDVSTLKYIIDDIYFLRYEYSIWSIFRASLWWKFPSFFLHLQMSPESLLKIIEKMKTKLKQEKDKKFGVVV